MALTEVAESLAFVRHNRRQRKQRVITIDKGREDKDGITKVLLKGMGYTVVSQKLLLGDYHWESKLGLVVLERKTPRDILDIERLRSQVSRLRRAAEAGSIFPIILVDWRDSASPWEDMSLDNIEMACQGKIHVAHCSQGQLADRLDNLYKYTNKYKHDILEVL